MKKRMGIVAGGLAVVVAAAIPTAGAFGQSESHCAKYYVALNTANSTITQTNSNQSTNVHNYLNGAFFGSKCAP